MRDYERLREVLYWLLNLHHDIGKNGRRPSNDEWEDALAEGTAAIAETSEESEMERLKAWLGERITAECDAVEAHLRQPGRELAEHQGKRSAYTDVLQEIGAEFGYGEEQDGRERD